MANAAFDENGAKTLLGETNDSNRTPSPILVDPVTKRVLVDLEGGGGGTWGTITGTLSDQTDLQTALNAKVDIAGDTMTGKLEIDTSSDTDYNLHSHWPGTGSGGVIYGHLFTNESGTDFISGDGAVVKIELLNATDLGRGLRVQNAGTGSGIFVDQNNGGVGIEIEVDDNSGNAAFGMYIDVDSNASAEVIGIDIASVTSGGARAVGLRVDKATNATESYAIQLSDSSGVPAGGITFSDDANWYRIIDDVLASDDSARFAGYLSIGSVSEPANTTAGDLTAVRGFFSGDVTVSDEAYGVGWNGSTEVPTKNAVYDKIESLSGVYQPLDSDLTTLAGLTATTNNFIISVGSAWASRTPTQALATLGLDADLTTFSVPASTTISAFGATLVDDADAATARTTLGLVAGGAGDIWVEKAGDTMTGDLNVPDEAYGVGWNGSTEVPTKNAVYDKIETLSAGAGEMQHLIFTAKSNMPPSSAFATFDTRNNHSVLDFDGSTDEEAVFESVLPTTYTGGGLTIDIYVAFTSATSGSVRLQTAIERMDASSLDIDADSFASFNSAGGTAPGTSGQIIKITITHASGAEMDSLAAGEAFRLKVRRDADGTSGTDDIATDMELLRVVVRET